MTLRNTEFRIRFASKAGRLYYVFAKDETGWHQTTSAGRRHKATAEQVLNHVLAVLAEREPGVRLKPGVEMTVDYVPQRSPSESGPTAARSAPPDGGCVSAR